MHRLFLGLLLLAGPLSCATTGDDKAERGPGGIHPDLNGYWQAMNEAHYDLERHMARSSLEEREGPRGPVPSKGTLAMGAIASVPPGLGVVEGDVIPYTPEALAKRDENRANWLSRDPEIKCYLPGVPRSTYMPTPFQIIQGDQEAFIVHTYANAVRNIYAEDPGPAPIDSWMGQTVLSWEGDTMVLTTTGQLADTWFDRAGNHHSEQMVVVERFTPNGPNHLDYEATITDPATFTRPWKISMPLYRRMEADIKILDYKCPEFVEELLYGDFRRHPLK